MTMFYAPDWRDREDNKMKELKLEDFVKDSDLVHEDKLLSLIDAFDENKTPAMRNLVVDEFKKYRQTKEYEKFGSFMDSIYDATMVNYDSYVRKMNEDYL